MRVKCILCDKIDQLDNWCPTAKKLRNRPIHTYMCQECNDRIGERTKERWATGHFTIPHRKEAQEEMND
ncbi:YlaI family protein [Tuberibacillus sp. Marseille-P3662]|uniref:YlaI family protein n=1 Tax=Tuberibacillus sp. Marseille-P3662 TaxID=1965358 RepID=UPI000A1C812D|nr:YlaI family protein [Tuberibacillus sp. Marseille-P3662]